MAAKKSAKVKLPPMFARVVVKDRLTDAASRARVFECLATFDAAPVRLELAKRIELERGFLARQRQSLPRAAREAMDFAVRVHEVLERVASTAGMWLGMREVKGAGWEGLEPGLLEGLQRLMDLVFESQESFDAAARRPVAGIGGNGLWEIGPHVVTSALEAAVLLANDVRLSVLSVARNPFVQFLPLVDPREAKEGGWRCAPIAGGAQVWARGSSDGSTVIHIVAASAQAQRSLPLKQSGREMPASPQETDPRDVAILRAMQAGNSGKQVAPATKRFGPPSSESHVAKRRQDLARWGWITRGREARLTPAGEKWLAGIPPTNPPGRSL